jgi:acylphosphatase
MEGHRGSEMKLRRCECAMASTRYGKLKRMPKTIARRYLVSGEVQGVGYRYFAQKHALELGLSGYARNLDDGRVEVLAAGPERKLSEFAGRLRQGPAWSDVRGVEEHEAPMLEYKGFHIRP